MENVRHGAIPRLRRGGAGARAVRRRAATSNRRMPATSSIDTPGSGSSRRPRPFTRLSSRTRGAEVAPRCGGTGGLAAHRRRVRSRRHRLLSAAAHRGARRDRLAPLLRRHPAPSRERARLVASAGYSDHPTSAVRSRRFDPWLPGVRARCGARARAHPPGQPAPRSDIIVCLNSSTYTVRGSGAWGALLQLVASVWSAKRCNVYDMSIHGMITPAHHL